MPAPKGNTNALKHGLNAKLFNESQRAGLHRMSWDDYRHEINATRVAGSRIFGLLQLALSQPVVDIAQVTKLANLLARTVTTTCTSARTHAILSGGDIPARDALSQALRDVPFDEPDDGT